MAVIVSDNRNTSYDTKLATTNGFYRAEAYNLGTAGNTGLVTTTIRTISVTFANAGNCQGIMMGVMSVSLVNDRSLGVRLQEVKTVSSFNTSTERVNITSHGLIDGTQISFTSTGTLPTGITSNNLYYVINSTTNDFQISATVGGSVIGLSGTPSGTATCWVTRAEKVLISSEIIGTFTSPGANGYDYGIFFVPFKFDTPYAVDTTALKWRFHVNQLDGTAGNFYMMTSDATNMTYVAWCDNKLSHTDNDTIIVVDKVIIDKTATFASLLGTGDTVYGTAGIICRNTDYSLSNVALLEWENTPSASYLLTVRGNVWMGTHSGFRIGTSSSRISNALKARIYFDTPNVGTYNHSGISRPIATHGSTQSSLACRESLFLYGEVPTYQRTTLTADASIGATSITVADSTGWGSGDIICIGKQDVKGSGATTKHTISSVVGTTINFSPAVASYNRKSGGAVVMLNGYGIEISSVSNANYGEMIMPSPSNYVVSGVQHTDFRHYPVTSTSGFYYLLDDSSYISQFTIEDSSAYMSGTTVVYLCSSIIPSPLGALFQRVNTVGCTLLTNGQAVSNSNLKSGTYIIKDNVILSMGTSAFGTTSSVAKLDAQNNVLENSSRYGWYISGTGVTFKNNKIWGVNSTLSSGYYSLMLGTIINSTDISGNYINNCANGLQLNGISVKSSSSNFIFGNETANTNDIDILAGSLVDFSINGTTGLSTIDTSKIPDTILGSRFRILNYNGTTNDDRNWLTNGEIVRTGDSLPDTTVHTSGTGKYAIRLLSNTVDALTWSFNNPTGNIQGKDMTFIVWCKINSANYYAWSYSKPRLSITYDNGTVAYAEATNSTDWQKLVVDFTPTTTSSQITVNLSALTEAIGSDAYVYFDDFSALLPQGSQVNTGGLDTWADALPDLPIYATGANSSDIAEAVWSKKLSEITSTGSTGEIQKNPPSLLVGGKIII
jgi:hypothetical protein